MNKQIIIKNNLNFQFAITKIPLIIFVLLVAYRIVEQFVSSPQNLDFVLLYIIVIPVVYGVVSIIKLAGLYIYSYIYHRSNYWLKNNFNIENIIQEYHLDKPLEISISSPEPVSSKQRIEIEDGNKLEQVDKHPILLSEKQKKLIKEGTTTELKSVYISSSNKSSLWEICISPNSLENAWNKVAQRSAGPGSDGITVEKFALEAEKNLALLTQELTSGQYLISRPRVVEIPKHSGGFRKISIFPVKDRIVFFSLQSQLSQRWNSRFAPCSYAYRPNKSALDAVNAIENYMKKGCNWVVNTDIKEFFDSVNHQQMAEILGAWLNDNELKNFIIKNLSEVSKNGFGLSHGGLCKASHKLPCVFSMC